MPSHHRLARLMPWQVRHLLRPLLTDRSWSQELCAYYGVTPEEAERLGQRRPGRRPVLPGSPTTRPVAGKTFEEIWEERSRTTEADIYAFYEDIGAWAAFRQVYYRRDLNAKRFVSGLPPGGSLCEYGGGVGPIIRWAVEHRRRQACTFTLVDVPSEHLRFGAWRIQRAIIRFRSTHRFEVLEVRPGMLPLSTVYDTIAILEVYEHLPNPLEVTRHLISHLKQGGSLWENFIPHQDAHGADLEAAQREREDVFRLLREHCVLEVGRDPELDSRGTRCWRLR